jgi:hypothetical protein
MPHATVVPAHPPPHAGARTHAAVRPMLADAQASGDHPRPLRLPRTWGLLRPRGPPLHAPAAYAR